MIHVFVKGKDDFGKTPVNRHKAIYTQHWPRSKKNDIHVYYYPDQPSVGIYQVTEEIDYDRCYKSEMQICKGYMRNLLAGKTLPKQFLNRLLRSDKESMKSLGKRLDDIIYDLQKAYNPEILINEKRR